MSSQKAAFSATGNETLKPLAPEVWTVYPGLRKGRNPNNTRFRSTVRDRGYNLPQQRQANRRGYDLLGATADYATWAHKGERLKYVHDVYVTHPKAVSERMYTPREKAVAYLHDVVENRVTEILGKYDSAPHDWETYKKDEAIVIAQTLEEIKTYYRNCRIFDVQDILDDVNILTKRISDRDYGAYIDRLLKNGSDTAIKVKLADIEDNSLPSRNPPVTCQTDKDVKRLKRYQEAIAKIKAKRPDLVAQMRLRRPERFNIRAVAGGRTSANSKRAESGRQKWRQGRNAQSAPMPK